MLSFVLHSLLTRKWESPKILDTNCGILIEYSSLLRLYIFKKEPYINNVETELSYNLMMIFWSENEKHMFYT